MSSAVGSVGLGITRTSRRELIILAIIVFLLVVVARLLRRDLAVFGFIEVIMICTFGGLAIFNYFRIYDSLDVGVITDIEITSCKKCLDWHVGWSIALFLACYCTILLDVVSYFISFLLSVIYFVFTRSNALILTMINRECGARISDLAEHDEDSAYKYTLIAANHIYFYEEENVPSLIAYFTLTVLCTALVLLPLVSPMVPVVGVNSLTTGAALFHLGLSTIRFRRIFVSSDDIIERLVRLGVHDEADKNHRSRLKRACELSTNKAGERFERMSVLGFVISFALCIAAFALASHDADPNSLPANHAAGLNLGNRT